MCRKDKLAYLLVAFVVLLFALAISEAIPSVVLVVTLFFISVSCMLLLGAVNGHL